VKNIFLNENCGKLTLSSFAKTTLKKHLVVKREGNVNLCPQGYMLRNLL